MDALVGIQRGQAAGLSPDQIIEGLATQPAFRDPIARGRAAGVGAPEMIQAILQQLRRDDIKADGVGVEGRTRDQIRRTTELVGRPVAPGEGAQTAQALAAARRPVGILEALSQGAASGYGIPVEERVAEQRPLAQTLGLLGGQLLGLGLPGASVGRAALQPTLRQVLGRSALSGALTGATFSGGQAALETGAQGGSLAEASGAALEAIPPGAILGGLAAPAVGSLAHLLRLQRLGQQQRVAQGRAELGVGLQEIAQELQRARTPLPPQEYPVFRTLAGDPLVSAPERLPFSENVPIFETTFTGPALRARSPQPALSRPSVAGSSPSPPPSGASGAPVMGPSLRTTQAVTLVEADLQKAGAHLDTIVQHIKSVQETGTLPPDLRAGIAKGAPAKPSTVVSQSINREIGQQMVGAAEEVRRLRVLVSQTGDPVAEAQLAQAEIQLLPWVARWREVRRSSSESLRVFQDALPALAAVRDVLQSVPAIKQGLPLLDEFVAQVRRRDWSKALAAGVDAFRTGLFPLASGLRDFVTNSLAATMKLPAYLAADSFDLTATGTLPRTVGLIQAIRQRTTLPLAQRVGAGGEEAVLGLPEAVRTQLRSSYTGPELQLNREGPVFTTATVRGVPLDLALAPAVRLKQVADRAIGETFALGELYHQAIRRAAIRGLRGAPREQFIRQFVATPDSPAIASAVDVGNAVRFNRRLSVIEEQISNSTAVKLLFDAFPRWGFQFARWTAEALGINPSLWATIRKGNAHPRDVAAYLATMATGWAGVKLLNDLWYDHIDPKSMELVRPDGNRVRLSGLSPIPDAYLLAALTRGDLARAQMAAQFSSLPVLKHASLRRPSAGVLGPLMEQISMGYGQRPAQERIGNELVKLVNNAIPGQSLLSAVRVAVDPTVRQGIGENLPGVSYLAPPTINPATGEPLAPRQQLLGATLPTIKGLSLPGAVRLLSPVERVLFEHGFGIRRPRATAILEFEAAEVPAPLRREYEILVGHETNRLIGQVIDNPFFEARPLEARRRWLANLLGTARTLAKATLHATPHKPPPPPVPPGVRILPPALQQ